MYTFFKEDHREIEQLLDKATASGPQVDLTYFDEFRKRLLIHIGIEEKILLPAVKNKLNGKTHPTVEKLRL
jgi:hemerythrin superfamily protein